LRQSLHYANVTFAFSDDLALHPQATGSMTVTGTDARSQALEGLRLAARALMPHLATTDQRADLRLIDEAIARLALEPRPPGGISDFDPTRLGHLLDLAGPELAEELLARLTEDLTTTGEKLDLGAAGADWTLLREGSHVLISLAGSVGAISLQAMAETLNALAHRHDLDTLQTLMPPLTGELSALIDLVRRTTPTGLAR
jgi:HPt (histidine-containing phosphotransfer) domain-containing protein